MFHISYLRSDLVKRLSEVDKSDRINQDDVQLGTIGFWLTHIRCIFGALDVSESSIQMRYFRMEFRPLDQVILYDQKATCPQNTKYTYPKTQFRINVYKKGDKKTQILSQV